MPEKIKLTYFNFRAKAELIRYILIAGKIDFEDHRISSEDWPEIKVNTPAGQLPIVELCDGTVLNESMAIARHFARLTHLFGSYEMDIYRIDRAACTIDDLLEKLFDIFHENDAVKKEELKKEVHSKHFPHFLEIITKYLKETGGDFFSGKEPSFADLHLVNALDHFEASEYSSYPDVLRCFNAVLEHFHEIKEYRDRRKDTEL